MIPSGRWLVVYLVDGPPPPPWAPPWSAPRRNRAAPRLTFRPIGDAGAYPAWLRDLRDRSGVYVIRDRGGDVLYVGESHTDRLYGTITRHFQQWGRSKKPRRFGGGYRRPTDNDPGTRYDRGACEVAIAPTPADVERAVGLQNELIRKLTPRDNIQGQLPIEEPVPF